MYNKLNAKTVNSTKLLNCNKIQHPNIIFLQLNPTLEQKKLNLSHIKTHLVEEVSFCSFLEQSEEGQGNDAGNGGGVDVRDKRVVVQHGGSRWRGGREKGRRRRRRRRKRSEEVSGFGFGEKRGRKMESRSCGGCEEKRDRRNASDRVKPLECVAAANHVETQEHHAREARISCRPRIDFFNL